MLSWTGRQSWFFLMYMMNFRSVIYNSCVLKTWVVIYSFRLDCYRNAQYLLESKTTIQKWSPDKNVWCSALINLDNHNWCVWIQLVSSCDSNRFCDSAYSAVSKNQDVSYILFWNPNKQCYWLIVLKKTLPFQKSSAGTNDLQLTDLACVSRPRVHITRSNALNRISLMFLLWQSSPMYQ